MNKISVKLIDLTLSIFEDDNQVGRMIVQIKQPNGEKLLNTVLMSDQNDINISSIK